ncbi:MAG: fumarylacetoacetate hydrolase family protein [Chloroflexota bacterium]
MRIAIFDEYRMGLVARDDTVVPIDDLLEQYNPPGPEFLLPDLITHWEELRGELEQRNQAGGGTPLGDVRLRSPITRPSKIVCLIGNYREGTDRPKQIMDIFFKSPEGIIGPGDTVELPPHEASIFHHEAELAVVIGKEASRIPRQRAMDQIFGYTVYNDVSARGLDREGSSSFLGKSFDTFAAFGPWIVTPDEIDDVYNLRVTVRDSGEIRQDYNTSDMETRIDELIENISAVTTLHPGDVICCGTNHQGLGAMQDGDEVITAIDGIGEFTIYVRDEKKRTWERGVDEEMAARIRALGNEQPAGSEGAQA